MYVRSIPQRCSASTPLPSHARVAGDDAAAAVAVFNAELRCAKLACSNEPTYLRLKNEYIAPLPEHKQLSMTN